MLFDLRAHARRSPSVVALFAGALAAAGCGYTSQYEAPLDGRARPVWKENNVVMELSGGGLTAECQQEILQTTQYKRLRLASGDLRLDGGYWAPRYYGPVIIVATPGLAPPLPVPPLFVPRLPIGAHATIVGPPGSGMTVGSGGGSGGSNSGLGDALAKLAIIALIVLPAVAVGLAIANPESSTRSSQAIDQVNAYNDLVRSGQSSCAQVPFSVGGGS